MWTQTLRPVLRRLRESPGYAIAFVVTLGLGIGATSAIFSAVEGVLIRPLPYPNADRIVYVTQPLARSGTENASFSFTEIEDYRRQARTVAEIVEYGDWQFNVVGRGDPVLAYGGLVTSNYFTLLDIKPYLGRTLTADDDVSGAPAVAVLTYEFWRRVFDEDPAVLGRVIELTGVATTIVGVVEPGSHYAGTERAELYANYSTNAHYVGASMQEERSHRMTDVYALVRPGVPVDAARAEFEAIADRLHAAYPEHYSTERGFGIRLTPWRDVLVREARPTLLILTGAVALVLIVACANVGNLTLARLVARERELAVRAALGATPGQLRRQLLGEHLVLAIAGSVVGVAIAYVALDLLVSYAARMTLRAGEVGINGTVLAFSLAVGVGVAVLFAWVPRLPASSTAAPVLASGSGGGRSTVSRGQRRAQRALVAAQVAVSFVVLVGAGLLARSLVNLQQVETGLRTESLVTFKAPNMTQQRGDRNRQTFEELVERLAAYPGVESVATASAAPFDRLVVYAWRMRVEGASPELREAPVQMLTNSVSHSYFSTLDLPMVRGRAFTADDTATADRAVVVNESLAVLLFGAEDPLGRRVQWSYDGSSWAGWRTIVGVARDARELGPQSPPIATVYESAVQAAAGPAVIVRTAGDPAAAAREGARLVHELDAKRPVTDVWTLESALGEHVAPSRLNATLFGGFATLALAIAIVGLGGVLAFAVSERTREFGVRMALGAEPGRILRGVVGEGLTLAAVGLAGGAVVALALARTVEGILFGVSPRDAPTFVVAASVLAVASAAASWVPARRATQVDPNVALRAD
jgi:predicted permease